MLTPDVFARLDANLERRVRERTAQLEAANGELESFAYSVSHDLRAPLGGIDGWGLALLEDYGSHLDDRGRKYLDRVRSETQRMGFLIDDLLELSRVTRATMHQTVVDLSAIARTVATGLSEQNASRTVEFLIQPGLKARGDARLLEIAMANVFNNAVKFTGPRLEARIEFSSCPHRGRPGYKIQDNGVGFERRHADNPSDVELTIRAFERSRISNELIVVEDGQDAVDYLWGYERWIGRDVAWP